MLAAKTLGYSHARIIFRHIAPERDAAQPRLLDARHRAQHPGAGLALLPRPRRAAADRRVGPMVAEGQTFLLTAWWISTLPGLVIVFAGVGFSLIGDGLADRLGGGGVGRGENEGDDPLRRRGGRMTAPRMQPAAAAPGARPPHRVPGARRCRRAPRRELQRRRGRDARDRRRVRLGQERDAAARCSGSCQSPGGSIGGQVAVDGRDLLGCAPTRAARASAAARSR